jgi:hypothetical protein
MSAPCRTSSTRGPKRPSALGGAKRRKKSVGTKSSTVKRRRRPSSR